MKICNKCKEEKPLEEFNRGNDKYGLHYWCKNCEKEYRENNKERKARKNKTYYENNKKQILKTQHEYYINNKEKRTEYNKNYYKNNSEEIKENTKQYYNNNKEKVIKYRTDNKIKIQKQKKIYRKNNPDKVINDNTNRRKREKNAYGSGITKEEWLTIMNSTNWTCFYCDRKLTNKDRTLDHIIAISRGGPNIKKNLIPACKPCNCSKHNKIGSEWDRFGSLSIEKQNHISKIINKYSELIIDGE